MLNLSSVVHGVDDCDVRPRHSHGGAHSGRTLAGVWLAALSLCAALAGCASVGEDPGVGGGGDVITGAGSGFAPPTTDLPPGDGQPGGKRLGPPYPIVLAHGFFGFENFAGVDFASYFYNVKQELIEDDEMVYTPAVDPFNSSAVRGAQLLARIQEILAATGYEKVNIVAHSQGGLDARVVAHDHPELVASIVTISTPHFGSKIADIALKIVDDPGAQDVIDRLGRAIGAPIYSEIGEETSVFEAMRQFSGPGIQAFNAEYTDAPGVFYASVGGRSGHIAGGVDCMTQERAPFVSPFDGDLDPVNSLLSVTEFVLEGGIGEHIPNDGMVRSRDARWGHFWGCIPADHFDEVGQLFGQGPGQGNTWKYMDFYRSIIKRLHEEGF